MLEVRDLLVSFAHPLGLAGESVCGKSTMALAILRMVRLPGRITGGSVRLDGVGLSPLDDEAMRRLRLAAIALVPQGSMNSLNPVMRIGEQIADALADHGVSLARGALVPPHLRGTAAGGFAAFQDLAYGLTGPAAGLLADRFGYAVVFLVGGLAASVGFALVIALGWQRRLRVG